MFSKQLFKQSCKANGIMWLVITFLLCFTLACVMIIGGSGTVGDVAEGVTDTIIDHEIEASLKTQSLKYYDYATLGEEKFDTYYALELDKNVNAGRLYAQKVGVWVNDLTAASATSIPDCAGNLATLPAATTGVEVEESLQALYTTWAKAEPQASSFDLSTSEGQNAYLSAMNTWVANTPGAESVVASSASAAYKAAVSDVQAYALAYAQSLDSSYDATSSAYQQILGVIVVTVNPGNECDAYYSDHDVNIPADYDVTSLVTHYASGDLTDYIKTSERVSYRAKRAQTGAAVFLANLLTSSEAKEAIIATLSNYGITQEKYDSFGYDFAKTLTLATNIILSYQAEYDHQAEIMAANYAAGKYDSEEAYLNALATTKTGIKTELSTSFMTLLPTAVAEGLEEIGKMNVYSLIVGLIFFKMAGLLLPFIYIIMCANNLVSSQVDTGSMAYVLSTSTKRSTVAFTQMVYLLLSLLAMAFCSMITSFICFSIVDVTGTSMTYSSLALMNLGMFAVLAAVAGINFFTSCVFNRQKYSLALGGGITMFFLVATMLGLFGLKQIPSVVRFASLNYFNYFSLISLFDVTSIVNGTTAYIWKMLILLAIGAIGFVAGSLYFKKKDLPL